MSKAKEFNMLSTSFTFLRTDNRPLAKIFTKEGVTPYPLAKSLNSIEHTYDNTIDGLKELYTALTAHAANGHALLKGSLSRPLENESRRGLWDGQKTTTWLVIDIDKVSFEFLGCPPTADLEEIERCIVQKLPIAFQHSSRIAHASSSFKLSDTTTSLHLFYMLDTVYNTEVLKDYITNLHFSAPFDATVKLSSSAQSLLWTVDPAIVDNTRIVYIADPLFIGVDNPYPQNRFQLIESTYPTLSLRNEIAETDTSKVAEKKRKLLNRLRKEQGLSAHRPKLQNILIGNETYRVCTNPEALKMEYVRDNDTWVYYNINDGDSNAYYVWKSYPKIVWNFKGESPFLFEQANKEVYEWHLQQFSDAIENTTQALCFRDFKTDKYYNAIYDYKNDKFLEIAKSRKDSLKAFMAQHGEILTSTNMIETWDYCFDPTTDVVVDRANRWANRFSPTLYLRSEDKITSGGLTFQEWSIDTLNTYTPTINKVLRSLVGSCDESLKRFINWLAYIFQERKKAKTAWVFSGTQGTGKGVFFELIAKELFGKYCTIKTVENIEEKFNDYLETSLLICIEEFKLSDSSNPNKLKNLMNTYITENTVTIRAMQENQKEVQSFSNFIIFTNELEIMPLHSQERRYNVAPRQEVSLVQRYGPVIRDQIRNRIPGEIANFAKVLNGFPVFFEYVESPMENEAKEQMRNMSNTTVYYFVTALKHGDFEFFLEVFNMTPPVFGDDYITPARNIIREWGRTLLNADRPVTFRFPTAKALFLYKSFVNPKTSLQKYSKTVAFHGLENKLIKENNKVFRGYEVTFPLLTEEMKPIVANMIEDKNTSLTLVKP